MRVLHLTPELPYGTDAGGGRTREHLLCRRLVELGHDVLNLSPVLPDERDLSRRLADAGVETWVVQRPASPLRESAGAVLREPAVLATAVGAPVRALEMRVFLVQLRALIGRAVSEWKPDVVLIGHDMAAAWANEIPSEIPAVLTLHNLTWHWYLSRARRASGARALVLRAEAARYRRHVLRHLDRFTTAVAVSTKEADELRQLAATEVVVIPTGVDVDAFRPAPEQPGPPRIVFTGTLYYEPNAQGVVWFADEVWPLVRRALPDAQLDVVGRDPTPAVRSLDRRPGITVVGSVPVMAPYFDRAHLVVVPILTGAGIRVKIVEAMAAGRAIVSTSLGWEGLPHVVPGRHLLVADEPARFADAVVSLLRDPDRRTRMAAEARRLAECHYDWRALGDEQAAVLDRATRRPAA